MSDNVRNNHASLVLGELSEDAVRARLAELASTLSGDDFFELIVTLLVQSNMDRDRLKQRVADLIASRFGRSSEKATDAQLTLFQRLIQVMDDQNAAKAADAANAQGEQTASTDTNTDPPLSELMERTEDDIKARIAEQRLAKQAQREAAQQAKQEARASGAQTPAWPTHLPMREVTRDVPDSNKVCDSCDATRKVIGYETSWRIEYTTTAEVVVTKTPVVACGSHHGGPLAEPVAPKPVDSGRMGFTLAGYILYMRYSQNLPLRRIVEMLNAEGVPVSEEMVHTLNRVTAARIQPVLEALVSVVRLATLVNLDDTPVLVLKKDGQSVVHKARVWLALGDGRWAWFFATKNWKVEEAERRLGALAGTIQGDGYAGYPGFANRKGLGLAGCWGHARRKVDKALKAKDPRAGPAMALIQGLYRVEKLATLADLGPDDIVALRQERSAPLVRALAQWCREVAPSIVRGSPLGAAWTYLNNQWTTLQLFLTDGNVSLTNDAAERGLRRITIGRKLWLFFHQDENVEGAAAIASLMMTARLHGANERSYITWLLGELARREWSPESARCLLPDVWRASQKDEAQESTSSEM